MKKSDKFLCISAIIIIILLIAFVFPAKQNEKDTLYDTESISELSESSRNSSRSDSYIEGGVDEDYNYITNCNVLTEYNMPLLGIEQIGDEVDSVLKEAGITGNALTIADKEKLRGCINLKICTEAGSVVYVKYDYTANDLKVYMKE